MSQYNLIDEPWIPVIDMNGNRKELGIFDTLTSANELLRIEDPSPLVTASLYRFLLAVLYRALEGPCDIDEAKEFFKNGLPEDKIKQYLEKWKLRFYLFDDTYPFGQIPGFKPKHWRSWTAIAAEHNADNAKVLFDHIDVSNAGSINCASAVRWLIATQTYVTSAGKSELSHTGTAPSAGSAMVVPMGKNLQDTLIYCLVPQNKDILKNDLPLWEREPESIENLKKGIERHPSGFSDLYSWRSRSILLEKDMGSRVSRLAFASGVEVSDSELVDAMLAYIIVEKKEKGKEAKIKKKISVHLSDKGIWRDFDSLLPDNSGLAPKVVENAISLTRNIPERYPAGMMVFGQKYNPLRPNLIFWRKEYFVLPKQAKENRFIRNDIRNQLKEVNDTATVLYKACEIYSEEVIRHGDRKVEGKDLRNFIEQISSLPYYWSILEAKFHEVLRDYSKGKDPDDIHKDWLIGLRNAISDSWNLHRKSISGSDPWEVRAFVKADGIIGKAIKELNEKISILKEAI